MKRPVRLFFFFLLSACGACAQNSQSYLNDVGMTSYGINIPVENGFINISNGNLHLEFPLAKHPQRGALSLNESLVYDSRIWMFSPFGTHGSYHWWPYNVVGSSTTSGGWRLVKGNETGSITVSSGQIQNTSCWNGTYNQPYTIVTSSYSWTDPNGTVHPLQAGSTTKTVPTNCSGVQVGTFTNTWNGYATDASGYFATLTSNSAGNVSVTIQDSDGTQVYPSIIDRYGNSWSSDSQGNLIDDTGRIPVVTTTNGNTTYYDVLSPNGTIQNQGTRVRYTVTSASVPVATNFQQSDTYEWTLPTTLTPVQSILLPDGVSQYTFGYDSYGELNSITLPTGGVVTYGYSNFLDSSQTENRWLTSRQVGSNPAMTFTPSVGTTCVNYSSGCKEYVIVQKPSTDSTLYELTLANGAWNTGEYVYTGPIPVYTGTIPHGGPTIKPLVFTTTTYTYSNPCSGSTCVGSNNILSSLATKELFTNGSPAVYTQTQSAFDPLSGKQTSSKTWDFAPAASLNLTTAPTSTPARETDFSYVGFDTQQVNVKDQSGNLAAQTTYGFTTSATATSGVAQHGTQNAGGPYLKTVSHWLNTGGNSTTTYTMDDTGMVRGVTDANGNPASSITYQCSNSLLYQVKNPIGQMTQYGYDCSSGAIQSVQDPNDLASARTGTTYKYEALVGRIYTQTSPDGGVATYTYPSANEVDKATTATPDPTISSKSISDAFGRPYQSITAGNEVDQSYDINGRPYCTSNPYPQGSTTTGSTCISSYDGLDRPLIQSQSDGTSTLQWSYSANTTSATNEVSQTWTRTVDAFGRLTSVIEPGPSGSLTTNYSYDGLGNVANISQAGNAAGGDMARVRTFTYDSASRLVCASQPEASKSSCPTNAISTLPSGVLSYSYYPAGNVHQKTDGRGVMTTYSYDALNRLTSKQALGLNDAYVYDSTQTGPNTNGIGRLMVASNNVNADEVFSYDPRGRVNWQASWTPSSPNNTSIITSAVYDLAGNITSLTYPDGRTLKNGFDAAGRMASVQYQSWNGYSMNQSYFAETNGYDPASHLNKATFGNGVPFAAAYDNRERITNLTYGASTAPVWSKQLAWTPSSNLQSQTDLITGVQRQFNYDNLNRLTAAQDIFSNLAIPSGSNGQTGSTSSTGSGAEEAPGVSGEIPLWTDPNDSNLLINAGAPGTAGWGVASATISDGVAAPDGTLSASTLTGNAGSTDTYLADSASSASLFDGETVTGSVWLRSPAGAQTINLYFVESGSAGYDIPAYKQVVLTSSWQQYQLSGQFHYGHQTILLQIGGGGTIVAGQSVSLWGATLEDTGTSSPTITNFLPFSQRVTATSWGLNALATDNANQAPDGTSTAASVTGTSADSFITDTVKNPAPYTGQTITASVWLRAPSGSQRLLLTLLEDGNSPVGGVYVNLTGAWQRFQVSGTNSHTLNELALQIGGASTWSNSQVVQIWGAQMEFASTAGPYVATAGVPEGKEANLTNILPYSQQLSGSSWGTSGVILVNNALAAPDGSLTGAQMTGPQGATDAYMTNDVPNPSLYDAATVTGSVFLRCPSGTKTLGLYFAAENAFGRTYLAWNTVTLTPIWQRFTYTGQLPNGLTRLFLQIGGSSTFQGGQVVDVWGTQMELASHAGPYVSTTALPVITGSEPVNILPVSQVLNGPSWGIANGTATLNVAGAPDGTSTAATVTAASSSTDTYALNNVPNPSLYDGQTVTASIYLRVASGTLNTDLFLVNVGTNGWSDAGQTAVTLTTSWQRFAVTGTNQNGLSQLSLQIGGAGTITSGKSFQLWGAQMVIGGDPAPYTPTSSSTTVYATGQPGTLVQNGLNQSYSYDSFGNILQNGSFNTSYTANNQMFGYAYDAAGNLLSDGMNIMTWDAENRIATVGGATYIYDAEGNRIEKQGSSVTDTVYFGGQPIARLSGGQWTDLIYGPTGLLAEVPGTQTGAPTYRVTDNLGTNVGSLLANGAFVEPMDHTPFGQVFAGNTSDPFLYTSLERDNESGFDHATFRQYSSNTGRWMSPDPYDGSIDAGNPQTLNRYAYVGNMPLIYADPSGLDGESPISTGGGIGGCVGAVASDGGNIGADIGCAVSLVSDIESLFSHPKFTASHTPRPNARIWDEHGGFQVNPNEGIGDILGLPQAGCEFGACGESLTETPIKESKTIQQKISELEAAEIYVGPLETRFSPFHKGQITLRDNKWFCSQHVTLDQGSGSSGNPVTGSSHYDLVHPWANIPSSTIFHTLYDLIPDKIEDRFPWFPTGSDLCKIF